MTSFTSLSQYAPHLVLLAGLSWIAGLWGLGRAISLGIGLRLPSPWSSVVAVLLGIQTICLAVQLFGMAGLASRFILTTIWGLLVFSGVLAVLFALRRWRPVWTRPSPVSFLLLTIVIVAVTAGLLVAVAPSTKSDEIYYHMLVPSRIAQDGALHFYRAPWIAAVWPQMSYEVSSTPLHAIGYPDAPNVVSWALSALLLGFAWCVARSRGISPQVAAILIGALCVGLYPVVWYGNAGAHAMGDLAMSAAIVSFAQREFLIANAGRVRYAAMTSILLVSAAASKVSLLPICALLLGLNAWLLLRDVPWPQRARLLAAFLAPWAFFYCPILVWTWVQSGSPFGPMGAGILGASIYPVGEIQWALRYARDGFQPSLAQFAYSTAVNYSPLVWLGILGVATCTDLPRVTRAWLVAIFLVQSAAIFFLLPHDARFLGGIHLGLLIVLVIWSGKRLEQMLTPRLAVAIGAFFLLPWLAAQLYYATRFFPVALGLEREAFYQRNVAFFEDYAALDKLLPRDAVILAPELHTSAVYAPRRIFFNSRDLPGKGSPVLFFAGQDQSLAASYARPHKPGGRIYANDDANAIVYRSGRAPIRARLEVRRLTRMKF